MTETTARILPYILQPIHSADGEWVPRMWDLALAATDHEDAGNFVTLKMISASHGYDACYVQQEIPDDMIDATPSEVLDAVPPPANAPVDGMLVGRTTDEDGIMNWYVKPSLATSPALPAAPVAEGWRPIETAPKTSRCILVWCPENLCTYAVSWGKVSYDQGRFEREEWVIWGATVPLNKAPTHWMPLPPAPGAAPASDRQAEAPPSRGPLAWWAETGTAGAGEGCNKPFWLRHEAIDYVRKHGGHVAPLFPATPPGGEGKEALDAIARLIAGMESLPDERTVCVSLTSDDEEPADCDEPSPLTLGHLRALAARQEG